MSLPDFLELIALGFVLGMILHWCVKQIRLWRARRWIARRSAELLEDE